MAACRSCLLWATADRHSPAHKATALWERSCVRLSGRAADRKPVVAGSNPAARDSVPFGPLVQMENTPGSHAGDCRFEPGRDHHSEIAQVAEQREPSLQHKSVSPHHLIR